MNRLKKITACIIPILILVMCILPDNFSAAGTLSIIKCGGWFETAYVEWEGGSDGSEVYVKKSSDNESAYAKVDSPLIRGTRVDIPGLVGGTSYNVKIVSGGENAVCTVTPIAHDRSGYAHFNFAGGVGAYNNDGTPKSNATVIYVTDITKDTVTYNGQTGLFNILNKTSTADLIVRIIGAVNVPSGTGPHDGSNNADGANMVNLNTLRNITIEGIGYNANLIRWGFNISKAESIEIRNLYFSEYPDDAIGIQGSSSAKSKNIWIHNNSFAAGKNEYAGNGVDADKADGDGTTDIKRSDNVTVSYNYYESTHKTSLVGAGNSDMQDWITYHHNWFNKTFSRNPRARNAHIHMYNNYFSGIGSYGVGASNNSKIFTHANYFENSQKALDAEPHGSDPYSGTIKSFGDYFTSNCTYVGKGTQAVIAESRNDRPSIPNAVSGGEAYDHFDLDSSKIYSYTVQTPEAAKSTAMEYAGRMKNQDYNKGTLESVPTTTTPTTPTTTTPTTTTPTTTTPTTTTPTTTTPTTTPPTTSATTTTTAKPFEPLNGILIKGLDVFDSVNAANWSIQYGLKTGDKIYGDRDFTFTSLPEFTIGAEWIQMACDSKNMADDVATFYSAKDITVYIALDTRVANIPDWLESWTLTGQTATSPNDVTFNIYSEDYYENEDVELILGTNGNPAGVMMYSVFVVEKEKNTTTAVTALPITIYGDVNCDGTVGISDLILLAKRISNKAILSAQGEINAACDKGAGINGEDLLALIKYIADKSINLPL